MNWLESPLFLDTAAALRADPFALHALISAESGWNPNAYNPSGAVGLIQFMPRTLKDMGILPENISNLIPTEGVVPETVKQMVKSHFLSAYPTIQLQLTGPVLQYLRRYAPFPTEQSLFLSVFYPAFRTAHPDTAFPPYVQAANPGIKTVSDYVNFIKKKLKAENSPKEPHLEL